MCEKSKDESAVTKPEEKPAKRSYYYDDAHGYEDYDPDAEEPETDEGPTSTEPRSAQC
ncbi:MAG TPA: hypothetical protein VFZ49_08930 [Pyrinomonadaceae bacterium]